MSEVALTQVAALQAKQKSKDKEEEALKKQILDYQVPDFFLFTPRDQFLIPPLMKMVSLGFEHVFIAFFC